MTNAPERLARMIAAVDEDTVHAALGIRVDRLALDEVVFSVDVTPKLFMHGGWVHGGVYVLLGEGTCSTLTALRVDLDTERVAAQEINANHLRSTTEGVLVCTARPIDVGASTHVHGFEVRTGDGDLLSVGRCTVSVRPRR